MLSTLALTLNSVMLDGNRTMMETELIIGATSIAESFIEQAGALKFDEQVGLQPPSSFPYTFTSPGELGPDSGETYPGYNDVDDFDGYTATVSTSRADYTVTVSVRYCNSDGSYATSRTFYKRIDVSVGCSSLPTAIVQRRIFAYNSIL